MAGPRLFLLLPSCKFDPFLLLVDVSGSEEKAPFVCSNILLPGLEEKYSILLEPIKPLGLVSLVSIKIDPGLTLSSSL